MMSSEAEACTYVDHDPSLPYQLPEVGSTSAAGKAVKFAIRTRRRKPCASVNVL